MPIKTRGSAALDKAERRLASLKSIDVQLDLGHGLTLEAYDRMIEETRDLLSAHNTLLSEIEESRKTVAQVEKALSDLSSRMLSGVATRYGRNSIQYLKAGGSARSRRPVTTTPRESSSASPTSDAIASASTAA
jgi:uncharacterized protein YoxC